MLLWDVDGGERPTMGGNGRSTGGSAKVPDEDEPAHGPSDSAGL
jgi:hypothetical protein